MFLGKILSLEFLKQPTTKKVNEIHDDPAKMVKEPAPCDTLQHCIVTMNRKTSTFYLYQNPNPSSASVEMGKLLLAARMFKYCSHIEYVMSLDADDFSKKSKSYVGKLSSDYLGINFTIYENGLLRDDRVASKQISPTLANNFKVGQICYEFDELESEGPRNFVHSIKCPLGVNNSSMNKILNNITPKWHEDLQCLCFEFKGKVTHPEKDFLSVAAEEKCQKPGKEGDDENFLLRSKPIRDDTFTLVYRHPFSTIQAFAKFISGFRTYYKGTFYI